jgi:hypothetical protein
MLRCKLCTRLKFGHPLLSLHGLLPYTFRTPTADSNEDRTMNRECYGVSGERVLLVSEVVENFFKSVQFFLFTYKRLRGNLESLHPLSGFSR